MLSLFKVTGFYKNLALAAPSHVMVKAFRIGLGHAQSSLKITKNHWTRPGLRIHTSARSHQNFLMAIKSTHCIRNPAKDCPYPLHFTNLWLCGHCSAHNHTKCPDWYTSSTNWYFKINIQEWFKNQVYSVRIWLISYKNHLKVSPLISIYTAEERRASSIISSEEILDILKT